MKQAVALFKETDTRDELGLGSIRDILSDRLFPGTSTIQTRLRYFLFIAWLYKALETSGRADRVAQRARKHELELISPLLASGDTRGVIGQDARETLQRLPSSVYWAGLHRWGLFQQPWSREEYHRRFDEIRARRRNERHTDDKGVPSEGFITWSPHLPPAPNDLKEAASFKLTHDEADFIRGRVHNACPGTLMAFWMAAHGNSRPIPDQETPWDAARELPARLHSELDVARKFSVLMQGAAWIYNLSLAELSSHAMAEEWREGHAESLASWEQEAHQEGVLDWNLEELWTLCLHSGRVAPERTRRFVEEWQAALRTGELNNTKEASGLRLLIRDREVQLKHTRSRFKSSRALELWGGAAGTTPMTYRWNTASTFLSDLYAALDGDDD